MPPTLTFAPGTMCDRRIWEPVWRALGGRYGAAYIPIETRLTRAGIRALFDEASPGPLHLIGFSMGGYLSLEYALDRPGRVASLVTVCSSAAGLGDAEKAERARIIAWLETHAYGGIATQRLHQYIHPSRREDPAVAGVMKQMDHDLGKDVLIAQLRETTQRASLMPRLKDLAMPALFIGADADPYASEADIALMQSLAPGASLAIARDAGHLIPLEQPQWLAERITDFHESI